MSIYLSKVKYALMRFVVLTLWNFGCDRWLARLLSVLILRDPRNVVTASKNRTTILALDRIVFNNDVQTLKTYVSTYDFICYPGSIRKLLGGTIWPQELQDQIAFYSRKNQYKEFIERVSALYYEVLNFLERRLRQDFRIVLSGHINYSQEYPWIVAIHRRGGKFVSLYRESILSDYYAELVARDYQNYHFLYEGDAVLYYNSFAMDVNMKTGVVKPAQAFVTGCPRVDRICSFTESTEKHKEEEGFILLASFQDVSYDASKLWHSVLNVVAEDELLRSKTVVKCKDAHGMAELKKIFPDVAMVTGKLEDYLEMRPVVFVGFNSTACLDALIAEIPVVIPWWKEAETLKEKALLGPHTKDFHFIVYDPQSLIMVLKAYFTNTVVIKLAPRVSWRKNFALKEFIEYIYSPLDGQNCQRFFKAIDKLLHVPKG